MELQPLLLYPFEMLLKGMKRSWLVVPLAALILLFSAGAAIAPDCHLGPAPQAPTQSGALHTHSGVPHDHSSQPERLLLSGPLENSASVHGVLDEEMCFIVGFIVLLLLRFSRFLRSVSNLKGTLVQRPVRTLFRFQNLGYLNLTHLKLGIIRI
jgi:hypothetical protein